MAGDDNLNSRGHARTLTMVYVHTTLEHPTDVPSARQEPLVKSRPSGSHE
jgi:hypothetical protein